MVASVNQILIAAVVTAIMLTSASLLLKCRRMTIWQQFAQRHGLKFQNFQGEQRVSGTCNGREVRLIVSRNSSDTGILGVEEIAFSVQLHGPLPAGLRLQDAPGFVGAIQRVWDSELTATGDRDFDGSVLVWGDSPESVRDYLNSERRNAFLETMQNSGEAHLTLADGWLELQTRELLSRLAELEHYFRGLMRAAVVLDSRPEDEAHASASVNPRDCW